MSTSVQCNQTESLGWQREIPRDPTPHRGLAIPPPAFLTSSFEEGKRSQSSLNTYRQPGGLHLILSTTHLLGKETERVSTLLRAPELVGTTPRWHLESQPGWVLGSSVCVHHVPWAPMYSRQRSLLPILLGTWHKCLLHHRAARGLLGTMENHTCPSRVAGKWEKQLSNSEWTVNSVRGQLLGSHEIHHPLAWPPIFRNVYAGRWLKRRKRGPGRAAQLVRV